MTSENTLDKTRNSKKTYQRALISTSISIDYQLIPAKKKEKQLLLLLHGYQLSGRSMLRWILPELEKTNLLDSFTLLAPCGPYPVPKKRGNSYRVGYSWYFYDPYRDLYFIGPDMAVELLTKLQSKLKLDHLPTTILGYSQGGYLAPFLASALPNIKKIIGVSCRFLENEISESKKHDSIPLHSIHGKKDLILPWKATQRSYLASKKYFQTDKSTLTLFENGGHNLASEYAEAACKLLK